MNNQQPKQIIVIRKDLRNMNGEKIRTGKLIAQAAHASLGAILNYSNARITNSIDQVTLLLDNPAVVVWLSGEFTKICVYVNSEYELLDIYNKALDNNINVKLITDIGLTEFGGKPTNTCLALGPDYSTKLDPLTSHLSLV
jgi:PTH2 family peptidyl-tRNA hydrolase